MPEERPAIDINENDNFDKLIPSKINGDQLKVYPNPFSTSAVVLYKCSKLSEMPMLYLFNGIGQIIKEFQLAKQSGTIQLKGEDLSQGIYLLMLCTSENKTMLKIIIK